MGEGVAAVAAVDEETAEEALNLITVEYKELPGLFDPVEAAKPGAPLIHENLETYVRASTVNPIKGTNVCNHFQLRKRDGTILAREVKIYYATGAVFFA